MESAKIARRASTTYVPMVHAVLLRSPSINDFLFNIAKFVSTAIRIC